MMWNWLVSALASQATLLLYDGSPFYPSGKVLFDLADTEQMTLLGTSAKFIDACAKAGLEPARSHQLASLRTITSTGSPLVDESFDYVYQSVKRDVHLASISGGTDIISCFVLGNPIAPAYRGEIQARGLGMAVDVFGDDGKPLRAAKGELVCLKPFPSMPLGFWNDPEEKKYRAAYFARFPGVWCHGDWTTITEREGLVIYGRSDAVLNPSGVRIGTARLPPGRAGAGGIGEYRDRTKLEPRCAYCSLRAPAGRADSHAGNGAKIKDQIRKNTTPHHVPAKILQVGDIPRTKSGKIVETAVRDVVHGRPVKNKDALANPTVLDLYKDREELEG